MTAPVLYDSIGQGYDSTRRADPSITRGLIENLGASPQGRFLDLACGTGNYALALTKAGFHMVGVDRSQTMLRAARQKGPSMTWCLADVALLPFTTGSFDGAVCTLAIHHFDDLAAIFTEVRRVLRRGRFVIFTATPEQMRGYWLNAYFPIVMSRAIEAMPFREEVEEALDEAGFAVQGWAPWSVPLDPVDLFLFSGKHEPSLYLDPKVRAGMSSFARLGDPSVLDDGIALLREDIASRRIRSVVADHESDLGDYGFLSAECR